MVIFDNSAPEFNNSKVSISKMYSYRAVGCCQRGAQKSKRMGFHRAYRPSFNNIQRAIRL